MKISVYSKRFSKKDLKKWNKKVDLELLKLESPKEYEQKIILIRNKQIKILESRKKYLRSPKGKIFTANHSHKRRLLIKENYIKVTVQDWKDILNRQNNICLLCGNIFHNENKATQDHIIPLSKGGKHNKENLQALHQRCNSKKGARI